MLLLRFACLQKVDELFICESDRLVPRETKPLTATMRILARNLLTACVVLSLASAASAQQNDQSASSEILTDPVFSLRGFGTLGLAHSSEKRADFISYDLQGRGAGKSRSWSPDVDSRAGAQLDAKLTPELSAVFQVVSEIRYDKSYDPKVEWANIAYKVTPDLSVRAGRITLPTLMHTDSGKVGYSMPWLRAPVEVYSLFPVTSNDGVDARYRHQFGDVSNTLHVHLGERSANIPVGGSVSGKNGKGIVNTIQYGPLTVRAYYLKSTVTIGPLDFVNMYSNFGPDGVALADKYNSEDKPFRFRSIGASYEPGKWFLTGEWAEVKHDSFYGKRAGWYVSGGYRMGQFTPYMTFSEAKSRSNRSDPGLSYAPPLLNAALNDWLNDVPVQKTVSIGARWDFAKNAALKLQYDYTRIGDGSYGTLAYREDSFSEYLRSASGAKFRLFSVVLDFMF